MRAHHQSPNDVGLQPRLLAMQKRSCYKTMRFRPQASAERRLLHLALRG